MLDSKLLLITRTPYIWLCTVVLACLLMPQSALSKQVQLQVTMTPSFLGPGVCGYDTLPGVFVGTFFFDDTDDQDGSPGTIVVPKGFYTFQASGGLCGSFDESMVGGTGLLHVTLSGILFGFRTSIGFTRPTENNIIELSLGGSFFRFIDGSVPQNNVLSGIIGLSLSSDPLPLEQEIDVVPLLVDFGMVKAFDSSVMIVTVQNIGGSDLTLTGISLLGDTSFSTTNLPVVIAPGDTEDIFITFAPTSVGMKTGTLVISSDDANEPDVNVDLLGDGVQGDPVEQATALEVAVDDAVQAGALEGNGAGKSGDGRLGAFENMIEATGDLINGGFIEDACGQLRSSLRRIDGDPRPPDFVTGDAALLLAARIQFLLDSLECD